MASEPAGTARKRPTQGWTLLIKFGRQNHLERLRCIGELRFSAADRFAGRRDQVGQGRAGSVAQAQSDPVRRDEFEGTDEIWQPDEVRSLRIQTRGKTITLGGHRFVGPVRLAYGGMRNQVCCFFGWPDRTSTPSVDPRMDRFGGSFVVVLDTQEFLERVHRAAARLGYTFDYGPIAYYHATSYSGPTGVYRKPQQYAYQREFRFILQPGRWDPVHLQLGSCEDIISEVLPVSEFDNVWRLQDAD